MKVVGGQAMNEWEMHAVIGVCLLLDVIIMTSWQIIDPLRRDLENFDHEERQSTRGQNIDILPQLEHCVCDHINIWLGMRSHQYLGR